MFVTILNYVADAGILIGGPLAVIYLWLMLKSAHQSHPGEPS